MKILLIILIFIIIIYLSYGFLWSLLVKFNFFKKRKVSNKKEIYLTFDDGPSEYTEYLLEVLRKYNVNATFFCVASFAKKYPEVLKKSISYGNQIELHSLRHKNALLQGIFETKKDFYESFEIMKSMNIDVNYYRPPWGDANLFTSILLKKNKKKIILWNVMAEDWEKNTSANIIQSKLLKRVRAGDIICLHDGRGKNEAPKKTIEALDTVIPIFLKEGYIFKLIKDYER